MRELQRSLSLFLDQKNSPDFDLRPYLNVVLLAAKKIECSFALESDFDRPDVNEQSFGH